MQVNSNMSLNKIWNGIQDTYSSQEKSNKVDPVQKMSFDQIAKEYNMKNISPRELDQLVADLKESGMGWDFDTLGLLETRGAKFASHLAEIGAEQAGIESTYEPDKKINLIKTIEGNIEFRKEHNLNHELLDNLLSFVKKVDVGSVIPSQGLIA